LTGIVKKLLVYEQGKDSEFSGKTGSAYRDGKWTIALARFVHEISLVFND